MDSGFPRSSVVPWPPDRSGATDDCAVFVLEEMIRGEPQSTRAGELTQGQRALIFEGKEDRFNGRRQGSPPRSSRLPHYQHQVVETPPCARWVFVAVAE